MISFTCIATAFDSTVCFFRLANFGKVIWLVVSGHVCGCIALVFHKTSWLVVLVVF